MEIQRSYKQNYQILKWTQEHLEAYLESADIITGQHDESAR
jgi:hypothetical protein